MGQSVGVWIRSWGQNVRVWIRSWSRMLGCGLDHGGRYGGVV